MLFFLQQPGQDPLSVEDDLIQWPTEIWLGCEDRSFQFRTGQIEITLRNQPPRYSESVAGDSSRILTADTQIFIADSPSSTSRGKAGMGVLWSGLIDPAAVKVDDVNKTIRVRVLAHGARLNTIKAGLPDPDDPANRRFRWSKRADQWRKDWTAFNAGGNKFINNLGQREVLFTPSGYDALNPSDRLALGKIYLYDTSNRHRCGGPERDWLDGGLHEVGFYERYRHPDYATDSVLWDHTELQAPPGGWTRNPDSRIQLSAYPVTEIIQNLLQQYNEQHPHWPLSYDPTDTVLQSPPIQTEINLLAAGHAFRYLDMIEAGGNLYLAVIWQDNDTTIFPFTVYQVLNGSYLQVLIEDTWILQDTIQVPGFARINPSLSGRLYFYMLARRTLWTNPPLVNYKWKAYEITTASNNLIGFDRNVGTLLTDPWYNSLNFSAGVGNETLATGREPRAVESLTSQASTYGRRSDQLLYTGPLFLGRLALDYRDTSLARILTDLAIVTDSRFYISPDRVLHFRSHRQTGRDIPIPADALNRPYEVSCVTLRDEDLPAVTVGIQLAAQHLTALTNYYRDTRFPQQYTEGKINVERAAMSVQPNGYALSFDGTDDYVELPGTETIILPAVMSLCLRFRRHAVNAAVHIILSKGDSQDSAACFKIYLGGGGYSNRLTITQSVNGTTFPTNVIATSGVGDTEWHTIAFVNDATKALLYLDNVYLAEDNAPATGNLFANSQPIRLGCTYYRGARKDFLNADLTDLRLYTRALSTEEIAAYHNGGHGNFGQKDKALLFGFHCDEGRGDTLRDYSGNDHHGVIHGPAWIDSDFARAPIPPAPLIGDRPLLPEGEPSLGANALIADLSLDGEQALAIQTRTIPA